MPYFCTANLLFIHIPKTGGTSLETYFSEKFGPPSLYGFLDGSTQIRHAVHIKHSLQHLTMREIRVYNHYFKIVNPFVVTIVRNPYERIMSELFYRGKVKPDDTPDKVYKMLRWLVSANIDNHTSPQHTYIEGPLIVLHTETLEKDMHDIGFTDFHVVVNQNENKVHYYDYLNKDSIRFINWYYREDFERFGYTML